MKVHVGDILQFFSFGSFLLQIKKAALVEHIATRQNNFWGTKNHFGAKKKFNCIINMLLLQRFPIPKLKKWNSKIIGLFHFRYKQNEQSQLLPGKLEQH